MTTQGAEKNSGVASVIGQTEGAIGYVDLADAVKADLDLRLDPQPRRTTSSARPPTARHLRWPHAEIADDLSYDPLDAPGAGTYPITAPTYLIGARGPARRRTPPTRCGPTCDTCSRPVRTRRCRSATCRCPTSSADGPTTRSIRSTD
ncbi:MAG: hypothetical protein V9E94_14530 [Microthrixaceae bacterium]